MEMDENNIITFPNVLSALRIIFSPIIFFTKDNKFILFSVLIIIGLSDVLDGYIARKYKKQTIIGSRLDSIADFVFYTLLVIYTITFEFNVIIKVKYFIIIIVGIKILTIITGYIKHRKLGFLHTFGNKITGIIIFIGFCIFILLRSTIVVEIGLCISIISSLEELTITLIGKEYEENIKGIWKINKFRK